MATLFLILTVIIFLGYFFILYQYVQPKYIESRTFPKFFNMVLVGAVLAAVLGFLSYESMSLYTLGSIVISRNLFIWMGAWFAGISLFHFLWAKEI